MCRLLIIKGKSGAKKKKLRHFICLFQQKESAKWPRWAHSTEYGTRNQISFLLNLEISFREIIYLKYGTFCRYGMVFFTEPERKQGTKSTEPKKIKNKNFQTIYSLKFLSFLMIIKNLITRAN
jgi:hypothetical protein